MGGQKLPILVERVVVKSGLFSTTSEHSNLNIQVFGSAFIQAGVCCQIVKRQLNTVSEKGRSGLATARHVIALKFDGEVFNLRGSCGWDQIGQDYTKKCGGLDWQWTGKEMDVDITGVKPPAESNILMQLIREEQVLAMREVLRDVTQPANGANRNAEKRKI